MRRGREGRQRATRKAKEAGAATAGIRQNAAPQPAQRTGKAKNRREGVAAWIRALPRRRRAITTKICRHVAAHVKTAAGKPR